MPSPIKAKVSLDTRDYEAGIDRMRKSNNVLLREMSKFGDDEKRKLAKHALGAFGLVGGMRLIGGQLERGREEFSTARFASMKTGFSTGDQMLYQKAAERLGISVDAIISNLDNLPPHIKKVVTDLKETGVGQIGDAQRHGLEVWDDLIADLRGLIATLRVGLASGAGSLVDHARDFGKLMGSGFGGILGMLGVKSAGEYATDTAAYLRNKYFMGGIKDEQMIADKEKLLQFKKEKRAAAEKHDLQKSADGSDVFRIPGSFDALNRIGGFAQGGDVVTINHLGRIAHATERTARNTDIV